MLDLDLCVCRHDERGGAAPGGAWLPHAVSTQLSARALRGDARVLEEGGTGSADF